MTALPAARTPRGATAAAALFASGAVLLAYGFASTAILETLRASWQPPGVRRLSLFLLAALALTLAAGRLGRTRTPLILLASLWVAGAFGVVATASVALIAAAALGLGWRLSRSASFADGDPLEVALLRVAAGLAVIVSTVQALVHFPINSRLVHLLLLCGAAWLGRGGLREAGSRLRAFARARPERGAPLYAGAALLTVLAAHSAVAALPEVGSDALAMHLVITQQVASLREWPFDFAAYCWALFPMGGDWLYTVASLLGGEAAARLCNVALLAAIALLVRGQTRRSLPAALSSLLVAGCAAAPIVFRESSSLFVENLLTLFLIAAALIAARCWGRAASSDLAAFVLCAGGALMTKSLGLLVLPLVAGMAWSVARSAAPARLRTARLGLGLLLLLAVGGAPYLYAYAVSGNPLFPFFNDIFLSPYYDSHRFADSRWVGHGGPALLYDLTFRSSLFGENYDGAFGFHHLLLLPLGVIAALVRWPRAGRVMLVATAAVVCLLLAGTQYLRYLYAMLWAAAMVEAEGLALLLEPPWLGRASVAVASLAFVANLAFLPTGFYVLRSFPVDTIVSSEARERFVDAEAPYRRINEAVNAQSGTAARVLYLGAPHGALLEGVPVYTNWYNLAMALRVQEAATPEAVAQILVDGRITHVAIEHDPERRVFREWLSRHATKRLELDGCELYEVGPWTGAPGMR